MRLPESLLTILLATFLYNSIPVESRPTETKDYVKKEAEIALLPKTANLESRIKILLSPGHGPMDGVAHTGTRVGSFTEFEANYEIYSRLLGLLRKDPRFEVTGLKNKFSYNDEFKKNSRLHYRDVKNPDSLTNVYLYAPFKLKDVRHEYKNRLEATAKYSDRFDVFLEIHHDFTLSYLRDYIKSLGIKLNKRNFSRIMKSYIDKEYPYEGKGFHIIINPDTRNFANNVELAKSISRNMQTPISERIASYEKKYDYLKKFGISVRKNIKILKTGNRKTLKQIIESNHFKSVDNLSDKDKESYYNLSSILMYIGILEYYKYNPVSELSFRNIYETLTPEPKPLESIPNKIYK
ncbi:TPA: hypothetical protein HA235_07145 [Candidatus Woesearchaeota archaeon]|nr:hypothetical protein [uncultured archaeon]MBS3172795.1 N-acetylmuramoyl-L-alanine amidase [Candidatus Woesearchaeota archaeon]HIH32453.1 hypothetical protein [Candidatus Woesearchaeota archaeon]HIH55362.1 hypothetical protein [Candidatus Woesearchaeota archaeon]HIJ02290.1 hypothetical protein [Candidatus Woesearchaeota archaeon]